MVMVMMVVVMASGLGVLRARIRGWCCWSRGWATLGCLGPDTDADDGCHHGRKDQAFHKRTPTWFWARKQNKPFA
jgi:hypothetical protein